MMQEKRGRLTEGERRLIRTIVKMTHDLRHADPNADFINAMCELDIPPARLGNYGCRVLWRVAPRLPNRRQPSPNVIP